jgi:hypothetical protein
MAISIDTLTAQVRLESGLRNNLVLSDAQIQTFLGEAYSDLRDRLIVRFASWFRAEANFSLDGGSSGYVYDLTQLPDFQMAQGLDLEVSPGVWATVPLLGSYAERNAFYGMAPFQGTGYSYNGQCGRAYWIDGDRLEVLPPQNAAGNYRLVYTPIETMQAPVTTVVQLQPSDDFINLGGLGHVDLAGLTFDPSYLTGTVTLAYNAPNAFVNGSYGVSTTPTGAHYVNLDRALPAGSWSGPSAGSVTLAYQPAGTVASLPDKLTPWSQYLVLYASIAVRNSRNQDVTALEGRYADIKQRVIDLTKQRTEGVKQAPITNNRYRRYGTGYGF